MLGHCLCMWKWPASVHMLRKPKGIGALYWRGELGVYEISLNCLLAKVPVIHPGYIPNKPAHSDQ